MSVINNAINAPLPLGAPQGGTGAVSPTIHGIVVAQGASAVNTKVLTNGELLIGSTGADPVGAALTSSGSTIAYTTGAGSLNLDLNVVTVAYGGTGLNSLTAHGILVGEGTSNVNPIVLTNGELLIGSTGADPVAATLTQGTGITITNGAGTITITASGGSPWVNETSSSVTMAVDTNYVANKSTLVTLTLPAVAAFGSTFQVTNIGSGGWLIAQGSGQQIRSGTSTTTSGATGSLASSNLGDSVSLVCTAANNSFSVISYIGNITIT